MNHPAQVNEFQYRGIVVQPLKNSVSIRNDKHFFSIGSCPGPVSWLFAFNFYFLSPLFITFKKTHTIYTYHFKIPVKEKMEIAFVIQFFFSCLVDVICCVLK